jgi:hypothetical protein
METQLTPETVNSSYLAAGAFFALLVFLVGRSVTCWYFKTTEMADTLKRIEALLKKQTGPPPTPPAPPTD